MDVNRRKLEWYKCFRFTRTVRGTTVLVIKYTKGRSRLIHRCKNSTNVPVFTIAVVRSEGGAQTPSTKLHVKRHAARVIRFVLILDCINSQARPALQILRAIGTDSVSNVVPLVQKSVVPQTSLAMSHESNCLQLSLGHTDTLIPKTNF